MCKVTVSDFLELITQRCQCVAICHNLPHADATYGRIGLQASCGGKFQQYRWYENVSSNPIINIIFFLSDFSWNWRVASGFWLVLDDIGHQANLMKNCSSSLLLFFGRTLLIEYKLNGISWWSVKVKYLERIWLLFRWLWSHRACQKVCWHKMWHLCLTHSKPKSIASTGCTEGQLQRRASQFDMQLTRKATWWLSELNVMAIGKIADSR